MKLGSLLCIGAAAAALPLCATDFTLTGTDNQILGWMKIDSSAENTIIAVPWKGVDGSAVKVADLVRKDTLSAGDYLYVYDAGVWNAFKLNADRTAWEAQPTAGKDGPATVTVAAAKTLDRGKAIFLQRSDKTSDIYVYGKYDASDVSVTVAAGTAETPAYTLIANPNDADFDLNGTGVWTTLPAAGDIITVPGSDGSTADVYTWDVEESKWKHNVTTTVTRPNGRQANVVTPSPEGCTVAAGKGVWYVSKGTAATLKW